MLQNPDVTRTRKENRTELDGAGGDDVDDVDDDDDDDECTEQCWWRKETVALISGIDSVVEVYI